jgi:hypothetical protein
MDKAKSSHETHDTSTGKNAEKSSPSQDTTKSTLSSSQNKLGVANLMGKKLEPIDLEEIEKLFILMTRYEITEVKIGDSIYIAKVRWSQPVQTVTSTSDKKDKKDKNPDELILDEDMYNAVT